MDIKELSRAVPFGNSAFQIVKFIVNEETPERALRVALLNYDAKMKALKESEFKRRRKEIDIAETKEKLQTAKGFEKQRLEIDLEEAEYGMAEESKLIEDALIELALYEKIIKALPEISREQFESSEQKYWATRLLKQAKLEIQSMGTITYGVIESLDKMGVPITRTDKGELAIPTEVIKLINGGSDEQNKI
mgnify:CR=1 FL=1